MKKIFLQFSKFIIYILKKIRFVRNLLLGLPIYKFYIHRLNKKDRNYKVVSTQDTLKFIIKNKVSVSRFGDGEFDWIMLKRSANNFEKNSVELSIALKKVLNTKNDKLIVCIPKIFNGLNTFTVQAKSFWAWNFLRNIKSWQQLLDVHREYYDSLFTRPYMDLKDKTSSIETFRLVKSIWNSRDVIMVEGEKTRFGVGNNLLDNSNSVKRIIAPSENAFERYSQILESTLEIIENSNFKDPVVLVALGPTATVLCDDLSHYYQSIDIGHLDIEYSWFLMHATQKVDVDFKYVNEVRGGEKVTSIASKYEQKKYMKEIILRIK